MIEFFIDWGVLKEVKDWEEKMLFEFVVESGYIYVLDFFFLG